MCLRSLAVGHRISLVVETSFVLRVIFYSL